MSAFLGFESYLVPLGASVADVHAAIKTTLTNYGWQVLAENSASNPAWLDVCPPATETIGGNGAFEFTRIKMNGTIITMYPLKKWTTAFPQQVHLWPKTAGAVTVSCTLNGATVSYTGSAANTATDNLMGLYAAIRDSADANFTGWEWEVSYPATQNGNDLAVNIYGTNKTLEANKTFTVNTNVNGGIFSNYTAPGFTQAEANAQGNIAAVTTDLIQGFILYIQVSARGIAIATKTTVSMYGPMHACWGNNAAAVAYLPSDSKYLSPIELVVGYDDPSNNMDSWGVCATGWMLSSYSAPLADYAAAYGFAPPCKGVRRHRFTECFGLTASMDSNTWYPEKQGLLGSGMFWDDMALGNDFQIHRVKRPHYNFFQSSLGSGMTPVSFWVHPGLELEDWFKFRGTAANESLVLVADTVNTSTLAGNYTPGDTSVALLDASSFATSGFIVIGAETLQYTGKAGNTLTGITGAKYATVAARHFSGDVVGQGLWFVIINGGALLAGYNKPV